MNLLDQIKNDLITAQKSKNELVLATLRLLLSSVKNREIEVKKPLSTEEIVSVIRKEVKMRSDAFDAFSKAGRTELAEKEASESQVLQKYLPVEMSDEEIKIIIRSVIDNMGTSTGDFGKVMGQVMSKVGQKANGQRVSELVKEMLHE